jgi:transposase
VATKISSTLTFEEKPLPIPHITMRQIREALRLSLHEGLSLRQVGASLGVSPSALGDYVRRAKRAGFTTWPLLFEEYRERHPDGYGYSQFCSLYGVSR